MPIFDRVNVAAALAIDRPGHVLLADLHVAAHGDAALLMGVEPRFSVVDALDNTAPAGLWALACAANLINQ